MKTGEAAKLLGVNDETIRNWIKRDEFDRYFSSGAKGEGSSHRVLLPADVDVLNTIAVMRNQQNVTEWEQIAAFLESGQRYTQLPDNPLSFDQRTVSVPHAEQSAKAAATYAELQSANSQINDLKTQIATIIADHQQTIERLQNRHNEETDRLHERYQSRIDALYDRIAKLNRQIGRFEGDDQDDD